MKTLVESAPNKDKQIEISVPDNLPEVFADGLVGLAVGYPNTKLTFTSTSLLGRKEGVDARNAVCTLVVPTATLINVVDTIGRALVEHEDFLMGANATFRDAIAKHLAGFSQKSND